MTKTSQGIIREALAHLQHGLDWLGKLAGDGAREFAVAKVKLIQEARYELVAPKEVDLIWEATDSRYIMDASEVVGVVHGTCQDANDMVDWLGAHHPEGAELPNGRNRFFKQELAVLTADNRAEHLPH